MLNLDRVVGYSLVNTKTQISAKKKISIIHSLFQTSPKSMLLPAPTDPMIKEFQLCQLQLQFSLQHGRGGGKGVPSSFLSPPWLQHPLAWGRYICRSKCRGNLYQISFLLRQQELVSFGFTDMVANIGGYLGLFIGLSCFAFIDYLCQLAVKLSDVISHKKHWM